jgi:hypothetical protein
MISLPCVSSFAQRYQKTKAVMEDVECTFCEFLTADMFSFLAHKAPSKKFKGGERESRELLEEFCRCGLPRLNQLNTKREGAFLATA